MYSKKSILTSTTFWSIVLLLCQAVGPSVDEVLTTGKFTTRDAWKIFQVCVTALVGVVARYSHGDLYTPRGIPGADPPQRITDSRRQLPDGDRGGRR